MVDTAHMCRSAAYCSLSLSCYEYKPSCSCLLMVRCARCGSLRNKPGLLCGLWLSSILSTCWLNNWHCTARQGHATAEVPWTFFQAYYAVPCIALLSTVSTVGGPPKAPLDHISFMHVMGTHECCACRSTLSTRNVGVKANLLRMWCSCVAVDPGNADAPPT